MYQGLFEVDVSMGSILWKKTNLDYDSAIANCDSYLGTNAYSGGSVLMDRYVKVKMILNIARNYDANFFAVDSNKYKFILAFLFDSKKDAQAFLNQVVDLSTQNNVIHAILLEKT